MIDKFERYFTNFKYNSAILEMVNKFYRYS